MGSSCTPIRGHVVDPVGGFLEMERKETSRKRSERQSQKGTNDLVVHENARFTPASERNFLRQPFVGVRCCLFSPCTSSPCHVVKCTVLLSQVHEDWSGGGFPRGTNMHHRRRTSQRLWARAWYVRVKAVFAIVRSFSDFIG